MTSAATKPASLRFSLPPAIDGLGARPWTPLPLVNSSGVADISRSSLDRAACSRARFGFFF